MIGFYSLASGFLTGKYRSKADMEGRIRAPRVEKYVNDDGFRVLDALEEVANKHGAKMGQVALAGSLRGRVSARRSPVRRIWVNWRN